MNIILILLILGVDFKYKILSIQGLDGQKSTKVKVIIWDTGKKIPSYDQCCYIYPMNLIQLVKRGLGRLRALIIEVPKESF